MAKDYGTVVATIVAVTAKAVRLDYHDDEQWVPRSLLHGGDEIQLDSMTVGESYELRIRDFKLQELGWT